MDTIKVTDFLGCMVRETNKRSYVTVLLDDKKFMFTFPDVHSELVVTPSMNDILTDYIEMEFLYSQRPPYMYEPYVVNRIYFWENECFEIIFDHMGKEYDLMFDDMSRGMTGRSISKNIARHENLFRNFATNDYKRLNCFAWYIVQELRKISLKTA